MGNISLTASMRSNLQSLQGIARNQNVVQNRLATGLKVSSAIDNPSSFYTAQSLNNRAGDLGSLLDSMSQGIQTIKAATQALEIATKMLEQAKAVANQALEKPKENILSVVSTEAELLTAINKGGKGAIVVAENILMSTNQSIILKDGMSLVGAQYIDANAKQTSLTFNFVGMVKNGIEVGNDSIVSDLAIDVTTDRRGNNGVIYAEGKTGVILQQLDISMNTEAHSTNERVYFAGIYGGDNELRGSINIRDKGAVGASNNWTVGIYRGKNTIRDDSKLNISTNSVYGFGIAEGKILTNNNAEINIDTKGNNAYGVWGGNITLNDDSQLNINTAKPRALGVDYSKIYLNQRAKINMSLKESIYSFNHGSTHINSALASINIVAENSIMNNHNILFVSGAKLSTKDGTYTAIDAGDIFVTGNDLNITTNGSDNKFAYDSKKAEISDAFKKIFNNFDAYINMKTDVTYATDNTKAVQYNNIITQFDSVINDAGYKGINLLLGHNLDINFNESHDSILKVKGIDSSIANLGLSNSKWHNNLDIEKSINELDMAISKLRSISVEFGNSFSIVSTREDFTAAMVNVLTEGADKLTLADMNQESANMLALQTRQQLAVNSLSLASQAAQSVLKLF